MGRFSSRSLVAACTLFALIATAVSPAVVEAFGPPMSQVDAHACCPDAIGAPAPMGQSGHAPMPCCEIGSRNLPEPVRSQTVRTEVASSTPAPEMRWQQPVGLTVEPRGRSSVPPVQIPLLLRTTILLV